MLDGHGYEEAFGKDSTAPYLAKTLAGEGKLLPNYYAVAQGGLANEIALLSGQGPTPQTAANCPEYTADRPRHGRAPKDRSKATAASTRPTTETLPGQLAAAKLTWKAYVEDIGNGAAGQPTTCRHPALGGPDPSQPRFRRRLRDLAQPVRLLRRADRKPRMRRERRRPRPARRRPEEGGKDPRPLLHRPQRLPRRQRNALRPRTARRPRRRRRLPRRPSCPRSRPRPPTRRRRPDRDHLRPGAADRARPPTPAPAAPRPNTRTCRRRRRRAPNRPRPARSNRAAAAAGSGCC